MANILIVVQDELLCDLLDVSLCRLGHDIEMTDSGEKAIDRIHEESFDLIILNVDLSGMTALDLLSQRSNVTKSHTKFLILIEELTTDIVKDFIDNGVNNLIGKPFHISDLLIQIQNILGSSAPVTSPQ